MAGAAEPIAGASLPPDARIAVIGGGKMGEAILGGWLASGEGPARGLAAASFTVADPGAERRAYLKERYGVACVPDACALQKADVVVLAVKPQVMMGVLESIRSQGAFSGGQGAPLFVSIAAGLATGRLEGALPDGARLVRVMPNLPLLAGAGATAVAGGSHASAADVALVQALFGCLGEAFVVDEDKIDAVCAISGSGPAYVALMIEELAKAGAAQGLPPELAARLALQTVHGTAALLRGTGQDAAELRRAVCSPGGTTLAALAAMEETGFSQAVAAGVDAAVRRSKELGAS